MKYGNLADYFSGFGFKRLTSVEIDPLASNGHEFNSITQFKRIFGENKQEFAAHILYLCDDEEKIIDENTGFTWYDARENHPTRSEYRLYYKYSEAIKQAKVDDLMVVALNSNDLKTNNIINQRALTVFIVKNGDNIERQLAWLFGFSLDDVSQNLNVNDNVIKGLDFFTDQILDRIGINQLSTDDKLKEIVLDKFPKCFPSTSEFSNFARSLVTDCNPMDGADYALIAWMEMETKIFRILEHELVYQRLAKGISDVDDFLEYSKSVQNRRKSRAGHALENHLRYLFDVIGLNYDYNVCTENKSRPDFLFPSLKAYCDKSFPAKSLHMLGAKTTCKDRWRQVLSEAKRIESKHLLTLELGISEEQTTEMKDNKLQLVVPRQIFPSYTARQQKWLMNLDDFILQVKKQQANG